MYDIPIRYLASVFVDAASIVPTPENTIALLERFKEYALLPITVEEAGTPRLAFSAASRGLTLIFLGGRFDVSLRPLKATDDERPAHNMGDFQDFCATAAALLSGAVDYFDRKGHRLAAVQEGIVERLSSDALTAVLPRLLTLPQEVPHGAVFEWDYRFAYRLPRTFGTHDETTYNIATVLRRQMQLQPIAGQAPSPVEGLQVNLDINTQPTDVSARFSTGSIVEFFAATPQWHRHLQEEVEALLQVGLEHDSR